MFSHGRVMAAVVLLATAFPTVPTAGQTLLDPQQEQREPFAGIPLFEIWSSETKEKKVAEPARSVSAPPSRFRIVSVPPEANS
jgi:hypothetical protein